MGPKAEVVPSPSPLLPTAFPRTCVLTCSVHLDKVSTREICTWAKLTERQRAGPKVALVGTGSRAHFLIPLGCVFSQAHPGDGQTLDLSEHLPGRSVLNKSDQVSRFQGVHGASFIGLFVVLYFFFNQMPRMVHNADE